MALFRTTGSRPIYLHSLVVCLAAVLLLIQSESMPVLELIIAGLFIPGTLVALMLVPFHTYPDFAFNLRAVVNILFWSVVMHWCRKWRMARKLRSSK